MYKHGNFLVVRYGGKLRESVLLHFNGKIRSAVESAFSYGGDFFRRDQNVYVFDFVLQLLGCTDVFLRNKVCRCLWQARDVCRLRQRWKTWYYRWARECGCLYIDEYRKSWHGVVSASSPRVATQYPSYGKPQAFYRSVLAQCLNGILGACGCESA